MITTRDIRDWYHRRVMRPMKVRGQWVVVSMKTWNVAAKFRMGGRADDRTGLESRGPHKGSGGSNPSPSANVI